MDNISNKIKYETYNLKYPHTLIEYRKLKYNPDFEEIVRKNAKNFEKTISVMREYWNIQDVEINRLSELMNNIEVILNDLEEFFNNTSEKAISDALNDNLVISEVLNRASNLFRELLTLDSRLNTFLNYYEIPAELDSRGIKLYYRLTELYSNFGFNPMVEQIITQELKNNKKS